MLFQPVERAAADKQDVFRVDLNELLLWMLPSALGRHIADSALQDLQQRLLHALAAHVACDGGILAFPRDLVDLVDVNDAPLCPLNIEIRSLNELEQNVFHIFAHIACLGERSRVRDGKGHIEHARQRLCQQRFTHAGGAKQQNIALLQVHIRLFHVQDTLIVVVHRNSQYHLGIVLPDDILVQPFLYLRRREDIDILRRGMGRGSLAAARGLSWSLAFLIQQRVAQLDALVADVHTRPNDHPLHFVLAFAAEVADEIFVFAVVFICHITPLSL